MQSRFVSLLVVAIVLNGCATTQTHVQAPSPCSDPIYAQLTREHPDSLSERAWQRLQSLERACVAARAESRRDMTGMGGMMGMGHGRGVIGVALMVVAAVAMAVTMTALH